MKRPSAMFLTQATDHPVEAILQPVSIERRLRVRFPLGLPVRYRTLGRDPYAGLGSVTNISSGGVLVTHQHQIRAGNTIELNVEWPSLLDGRVALNLVMEGIVVRCDTSSFAVELNRYEFRTTKRSVIPIHTSGGEELNTREEQICGSGRPDPM